MRNNLLLRIILLTKLIKIIYPVLKIFIDCLGTGCNRGIVEHSLPVGARTSVIYDLVEAASTAL